MHLASGAVRDFHAPKRRSARRGASQCRHCRLVADDLATPDDQYEPITCHSAPTYCPAETPKKKCSDKPSFVGHSLAPMLTPSAGLGSVPTCPILTEDLAKHIVHRHG